MASAWGRAESERDFALHDDGEVVDAICLIQDIEDDGHAVVVGQTAKDGPAGCVFRRDSPRSGIGMLHHEVLAFPEFLCQPVVELNGDDGGTLCEEGGGDGACSWADFNEGSASASAGGLGAAIDDLSVCEEMLTEGFARGGRDEGRGRQGDQEATVRAVRGEDDGSVV